MGVGQSSTTTPGEWVGGWSDKTKLILNSTQFEVVVEVEVRVEFDNYFSKKSTNRSFC